MPRRKSNRPPSYRRHRASGQAVVTLSGIDYYLGPYGTEASRTEYDRRVAEWMTNGRSVPVTTEQAAGMTIAELIVLFMKHAERRYVKNGKPTGELEYFKMAMRELRRLYGHTEAASFGPLNLKTLRDAMISGRKSRPPEKDYKVHCDGYARSVVNGCTRRIVRLFKWATTEELVPVTVYQALRTVEGLRRGENGVRDSRTVKPVPGAHIEAIEPHVSRQVWAMVQLQVLTGMRSGEVVQMRRSDIEIGEKLWVYRPRTHKTEHHDHAREVPLGPRAQEVLRPFLKFDLEAYLFSPAEAEAERRAIQRQNRKTKVQPSQARRKPKPNPKWAPKNRYGRDGYRQAVVRACEKANVPSWHPHQLRHNFATSVRRTHGIEAARALLGHSSIQTTEIYAEVDRTRAMEVAAAVG